MKKVLFFCRMFLFSLSALFPFLLRGEYLRDSRGNFIRYAGKLNSSPVMVRDCPPRSGEFRAVWIATVENIDFPRCRTAAEFCQHYRNLLRRIKAAGFTAVIFQIRSNCDAFYPSAYAPFSRWMTGQEAAGWKNFDPLKFMVTETRRLGMEFHAWFNPYRVTNSTALSKAEYLRTLAPQNFARRNPQWVISQKTGKSRRLFLDPGVPQVVQHITAVVREVISRYPVDAVHFDDYFYPYDPLKNEDAATFARYNPRRLALADWRRSNTDALVMSVRKCIDEVNCTRKKKVRFGISPFGIWANVKTHSAGSLTAGKESYATLFADTRKWVKYRVVDYIVPQIYWQFGHDVAAYAALTDWWCKTVRGSGVKLYIGMGAYRADAPGWGKGELINQMRYNRMKPEISGAAFFSCRSLFGEKIKPGAAELLNYLKRR